MAKKKSIRESALVDLANLQTEALAAKKASDEAHSKAVERSRAYDGKLNDLRIKVATGSYTTDDHLLDINIVVSSSVQRDGRYLAMAAFEKSLAPHKNELIAQLSHSSIAQSVEKIGLLPETPRLQLKVGGAFGRGRVLGGDASVSAVIPVVGQAGTVTDLLIPGWGGSSDKPELGSNIVLEDKLQQVLENEPNMNLAVGLWSKTLMLGRPLTRPDQVTGEVMVRREKCVLDLQSRMARMSAESNALKKIQGDPRQWSPSQVKLDGSQATVSFMENVSRIKQARRDLVQSMGEAVKLGMDKDPVSPIYQNAVKLLEETQEWDG